MDQLKVLLAEHAIEYREYDSGAISLPFVTQLDSGEEAVFPLFVFKLENLFGDAFIRLAIVPFMNRPSIGFSTAVGELMAHANHRMLGVKFGFDDDGDLELMLDLHTDIFNASGFADSLQLLADYARIHHPIFAAQITGPRSDDIQPGSDG